MTQRSTYIEWEDDNKVAARAAVRAMDRQFCRAVRREHPQLTVKRRHRRREQ